MTLPRSAADVLAGHVLFEIEAIDRMYLNLYQPRLQHGAGIAAFFVGHRGNRFASSGLMAPMTAAFTADIGHFAAARGLVGGRPGPGVPRRRGHGRGGHGDEGDLPAGHSAADDDLRRGWLHSPVAAAPRGTGRASAAGAAAAPADRVAVRAARTPARGRMGGMGGRGSR